MFHFFDKKLVQMIHTFFFFGLIAVGLGFLTLLEPLFARLFIALLFFFVGALFLYIAYHFQEIRSRLWEMMRPFQAVGNAMSEKRTTVKRTSSRRKKAAGA